MLQKPKDPIQIKQRYKNQHKEKPKHISQQDLYSLSSEATKTLLQYSSSSSFSSSSSASSSASSSMHSLSRKPKSLSKCNGKTTSTLKSRTGLANNGSRKKIAAFPKPKTNQARMCIWGNGEKPKSKNGQRLNLSSDLASGCEKVSGESVKLNGDSLNVKAEDITPINKSLGVSNLILSSERSSEVKTPPIEVSVSPEIQFGATDLLGSVVTPSVCYGTGHLLSGVTDRRKCRSRGILTVGDGLDYRLGNGKDGSEIDCDYSCGGRGSETVKESGAFVPLPADASVNWLLSPCDEDCGSPNDDSSRKLMNLGDVEGSSPSVWIGSDLDLVCDRSEHVLRILDTLSVDTPSDSGKTCMVSPRRFSEFEGFEGIFSGKIDDDFLSNGSVKQDKNGFDRSIYEEKSPLSIGSLSSGNVMQTPNSDSSSGENNNGCWLKMSEHGTCTLKPELDSEAQILGRARSTLDPLGVSFKFTDLNSSSCSENLRKNFDNHVSYVSVSSVDNMSQSHMRISWRDLLASCSSDMEELDCCRCLSDEDIGVDEFQKSVHGCSYRSKNGKSTGSACKSPECIEHEIAFPRRKKEINSSYKTKSCAESISTDGGGLAASEDFD